MDLFGTKTAKKLNELSLQITEQAKEYKASAEMQLQQKEQEYDLQLKAMRNEFFNQFNNFNTQIFPHYGVMKEQMVYQTLDDLYSVVSKIATTAALIPLYGEYEDGSELKPKDKLNAFLKTLTFEQKEIAYLYLLLQGEIFGYKEKIEFGVNAGVKQLRFLNPYNVVVLISQTFPYEIIGFRYFDSVHGENFDIDVEDMMYVRLFNPDVDINKQVRGLAPVRVLSQRLARIKAGLDVSVAQLQNGGVPGVLYDKFTGYESGAMGIRQNQIHKFWTNSSNKGLPYVASGDMGYLAIGSDLVELDLATLGDIDLDKICNVYHVPSTEYNRKDASTESNVQVHNKSFLTNGTLPIVKRFVDGINIQVLPDIDTKGIIKEDLSDIPELQPNMREKAEGYAASPIMIPNAVLEGLGQKRIDDDENMNKPWIKNGYTLFSEASVDTTELPNNAQDYAA